MRTVPTPRIGLGIDGVEAKLILGTNMTDVCIGKEGKKNQLSSRVEEELNRNQIAGQSPTTNLMSV